MNAPKGLRAGGRRLWRGVTDEHDLDGAQLALLEEACRQKDRADSLAEPAATDDPKAMRQEREAALAMARLLAALRLPDQAGRRPQRRHLRGVHQPSQPTSLSRARARMEAQPTRD